MIRPHDLMDDEVWAMLKASRDGDLDQVKALALNRPELVRCEYNYTPPIHFAVREGHLEVVRYLLVHGFDPNYRTYAFGDTLLAMAQDREYAEIADLLKQTLAQQFPLMDGINDFLDAARKGDLALIQSEIRRDSKLVLASNETGDTALHKAASGARLEVMMALLDAGAKIDAVRADGMRPINCALRVHNKEAAKTLATALLERGA